MPTILRGVRSAVRPAVPAEARRRDPGRCPGQLSSSPRSSPHAGPHRPDVPVARRVLRLRPARRGSRERDVGLFWRSRRGPTFRAAWVRDTGELYLFQHALGGPGGGSVHLLAPALGEAELDAPARRLGATSAAARARSSGCSRACRTSRAAGLRRAGSRRRPRIRAGGPVPARLGRAGRARRPAGRRRAARARPSVQAKCTRISPPRGQQARSPARRACRRASISRSSRAPDLQLPLGCGASVPDRPVADEEERAVAGRAVPGAPISTRSCVGRAVVGERTGGSPRGA